MASVNALLVCPGSLCCLLAVVCVLSEKFFCLLVDMQFFLSLSAYICKILFFDAVCGCLPAQVFFHVSHLKKGPVHLAYYLRIYFLCIQSGRIDM